MRVVYWLSLGRRSYREKVADNNINDTRRASLHTILRIHTVLSALLIYERGLSHV